MYRRTQRPEAQAALLDVQPEAQLASAGPLDELAASAGVLLGDQCPATEAPGPRLPAGSPGHRKLQGHHGAGGRKGEPACGHPRQEMGPAHFQRAVALHRTRAAVHGTHDGRQLLDTITEEPLVQADPDVGVHDHPSNLPPEWFAPGRGAAWTPLPGICGVNAAGLAP